MRALHQLCATVSSSTTTSAVITKEDDDESNNNKQQQQYEQLKEFAERAVEAEFCVFMKYCFERAENAFDNESGIENQICIAEGTDTNTEMGNTIVTVLGIDHHLAQSVASRVSLAHTQEFRSSSHVTVRILLCAFVLQGVFASPPDEISTENEQNGRQQQQQESFSATAGLARRLNIFFNIKNLVFNSGERGLHGFAFHPNYINNWYFFVNYSCRSAGCVNGAENGDTIIARYNAKSMYTSFFPIAVIPQPDTNHNGGCIQFSGLDGYLYIGLSDGGSGDDTGASSQYLKQLPGQMLRVDIDNMDESNDTSYPRWTIPSDNPFVNEPGALDEIWAYGLRNPWRFSFDRKTDDMYIADTGQGAREELNFQPSSSEGGENYGWRQCEGTLPNSKYKDEIPQGCDCETTCNGAWVPPILDYGRSSAGGRSVTGGYIYRGVKYPDMDGVYFYADYASGNVWGVIQDGSSWKNVISTNTEDAYEIQGVSTFGEDGFGELYIGGLNGELVRIRGGQERTDISTPTLVTSLNTAGVRVYMDDIDIECEIINEKKWGYTHPLRLCPMFRRYF